MPYVLESGDKRLSLQYPQVMGIINATPDSFFSGSRIQNIQKLLDTAGAMIDAGASILDIGGQSTRPGSEVISPEIELDRVFPLIEALRNTFPHIWISLDTYYSKVVDGCAPLGIDIVNDISSGEDDSEMLSRVAKGGWVYIAMHKLGTPKTMQENPHYGVPITEALEAYFLTKKEQFQSLGIKQWVLDPGFGFGKTIEHNYEILQNLSRFQQIDTPILAGLSRKSMIYKVLNSSPDQALNGTSVLNLVALQQGANILRVHDVLEAVETIKLFNKLQEVNP